MSKAFLRRCALNLLLVVGLLSQSHGASAATPYLGEYGVNCNIFEIIDRLDEQHQTNSYGIDRNLEDYIQMFGRSFLNRLRTHRNGGVWIDGGAGLAIALREWVGLDDPLIPNPFNRKPRQLSPRHGVAFGVKRPQSSSLDRFIRAHDPIEFQYIEGYIEEHDFDAMGLVGTADFLTSPFGAFTYTTDPVAVIEAYMKLLKIGGSLFLYVPDKNFEFVGDFYTQANKDEPAFVAWLKEAYGNENVKSEFTIFDDGLGFRVEIKKPTVAIPLRKLETKKFIQHPAAMPHRAYAPVTK